MSSPSWTATPVSVNSSAPACARRSASATAPCAFPPRSCASSRWPSPRASRPGRRRAPMPTSRSSAIHLERLFSLRRQEADAVGYEGGERYDALLDQYEPDMRVARLEPLLQRPARRARAVRAGDRGAASARRRVRAPHLPRARAARSGRAPGCRDRLRLRGRPPRRGGAPVRVGLRARRRAPDDARARGRPLLGTLRRPARGRSRPLRAGPHGRDRGHLLRQRHLARAARVAVALLGEHGRPLARLLGASPGRGSSGTFPDAARRRLARRSSCARPTWSSRR